MLAAAREGLDAVVVNPTTPVGEGDRSPTPTGRMIEGIASGRYRAYLATGLNIVDVRVWCRKLRFPANQFIRRRRPGFWHPRRPGCGRLRR